MIFSIIIWLVIIVSLIYLLIRKIVKGGFKKYMSSIGKLGGQNKVPKIADNRKIDDGLKKLNLIETI